MKINFYKELKISDTDSIDDINKELVKQTKLWHSREQTKPEEARKYLFYIDEAKKVFKSDQTKKEYDALLKEEAEEPKKQKEEKNKDDQKKAKAKSVEDQKQEQFFKWYKDAVKYLDSKQFDLAATASDKAMKYSASTSNETPALAKLSFVYYKNNQAKKALSTINEAILLNDNYAWAYRYKYYYVSSSNNPNKGELVNLLNLYVTKTEKHNDRSDTLEAYKYCLTQCYEILNRDDLAKSYAEKIISLNPDDADATKVLTILKNNEAIEQQLSQLKYPISPLQTKWFVICQKKWVRFLIWLVATSLVPSSQSSFFIYVVITIVVIFAPGMWARYRLREINKVKVQEDYLRDQLK